MTERKFTVIKGGASLGMNHTKRKLISAFATDTRLMGAMGLHLHWKITDAELVSDLHQFFYFDAEECGIESYRSLKNDDHQELAVMEQALLGGLGGSKVRITEKQAFFLVQQFAAKNQRFAVPLPEGKNEYEFLLETPVILSSKEHHSLLTKICAPILTDYQLINYYLMRSFCHDVEAVAFLSNDQLPLDILREKQEATLCKNTIEEHVDEHGLSYLCESLVEWNGNYTLVVSELTTSEQKVETVKKRSSFAVTSAEAAMMMNHPEFVTVYEVLIKMEDFHEAFSRISPNSMQTLHDSGRLYLEFKKNKDHIGRKVFKLNEDIHGLYYATEYGQLITAAYSLNDIQDIERALHRSSVANNIFPTAKYEFKEPILYEFIQSDFEDFTEFLDFLNSLN